jgi:hypothetical protein
MSIQHNVFQVFIEAADDPCSNGTLLATAQHVERRRPLSID